MLGTALLTVTPLFYSTINEKAPANSPGLSL
jgi:hypothetical protein